jgi:hypothetical protein
MGEFAFFLCGGYTSCNPRSRKDGRLRLVVKSLNGASMLIQVISRHDKDFDIHTHPIDPAKSPYASCPGCRGYAQKVNAFYAQLGITSALWANPDHQPPKYVERCKQYEYVLRVDACRVGAYVNESTWSLYIRGERHDFEYSTTPQPYREMSLLIPTPITENEVHLFRRYRNTNGPDCFEVVEELKFDTDNGKSTED